MEYYNFLYRVVFKKDKKWQWIKKNFRLLDIEMEITGPAIKFMTDGKYSFQFMVDDRETCSLKVHCICTGDNNERGKVDAPGGEYLEFIESRVQSRGGNLIYDSLISSVYVERNPIRRG